MIHSIPLRNTHQFSDFICDYVSGQNKFSFLPNNYFEKNYVRQIIDQRKSKPINRLTLVDVLTEQNIAANEATKKNIALLQNENCFTITTAHQPCFFGGPLYTFYKAISAIKLAEQYKKDFPENDFVPVYYIGSEDHDLAELNHFYLFNKKIEWHTQQAGAVGSMHLSGLNEIYSELELLLKNEEKKDEILSLLQSFYNENNSMTSAFRKLLNHFLGKFGLVILDANDKRLKTEFSSIFLDELKNKNSFKLLNEKSWLQNFRDDNSIL